MAELPVDQLLSVDAAIEILDSVPVRPRMVTRSLVEAIGLRLGEDLHADRDYPPFDKSLMDGFAVRAEDASVIGAQLRVIETIAAGQTGQRNVATGEAAAIMTGAPVPAGADAVLPVEFTKREGMHITLQRTISRGQAISRAASDALSGTLLLSAGSILGAAQLGVAACVGRAKVLVYDAPSVAILSTGDELVEMGETPTGSQIRDSNSIMMHALLKRLGCRVRNVGMVRDDPARIRAAIEQGLGEDALFVTGGMSMGEYDYVPRIFQEIGLEMRVSKLRIKPGKPFVFATGENGKLAFGLPGNPVSAFVCTMRLAGRVLNRLAGGPAAEPMIRAVLRGTLPANGSREQYIPGLLRDGFVEPRHPNGSGDLFTLANANCLISRKEQAPDAATGDHVIVIIA